LSIARKANPTTGTTGLIRYTANDPTSSLNFALSENGKCYKSLNELDFTWTELSNNPVGQTGNGIVFWKNWLFIARYGRIDVTDSDGLWHNNWQTLFSPNGNETEHYMLVGQDDILYIGNGRYMASLQENTGFTFSPTNAATYTWNNKALDLPSSFMVSSFAELGTKLMIGTKTLNSASYCYVFPWDRVSPSFDLPLSVGDTDIFQMVTRNNMLYFVAGDANLYKTNGSSLIRLFSFNDFMRNDGVTRILGVNTNNLYVDAVDIINNKIYFGIGTNSDIPYGGIWSIDENDKPTLEHRTSIDAGADAIKIGSISQVRFGGFVASSKYGSSVVGLDWIGHRITPATTSNMMLYPNYQAYCESQLYEVGTELNPRTFQKLQFILSRKLKSGQGVRISYRTNLTDSYTLYGTYDYATI